MTGPGSAPTRDPLPDDLPVVDHHAHLSPSGEGVTAAQRFRDAGGTHLFLATQNYERTVPLTLADYSRQFEITVQLGAKVEREVGVVVYPVLAPYPIDLVGQVDRLGPEAAVGLQRAALDEAGRWVRDQKAVALGEVGRPHFPVEERLRAASEEVFRYALGVARDVGCPAVVHCEDLDAVGFRALAAFASAESFPLGRLVKHYARQAVPAAERLGVAASYLARRELIPEILGGPGPWFLETDFLDDPARPGAVLDLATVPRRAKAMAASVADGVERLREPFQRSVRSVYGFTPFEDGRGAP